MTKKLTLYSKEIIGIDVSENMINKAKKRNYDITINDIKASAEKYLEETDKKFDVIISIAALHHMNEEKIVGLMKTKLTDNGKILILDLVKTETIMEWVLALLAALLNPFIMLIMRGRVKATKEEKEAWPGHFQHDTYLSVGEVKV